jgi:two-component system, OmpR family, response regulator
MSVLLVEDDERIVEFVRRGLEAEGYQIAVATTGADAVRMARRGRPALIILDLLLPDIDGREVCRRLRAAQVHVPILMLTALDTLEDKVSGLQIGADDYLTKPFAFEELLARLQALQRRGGDYNEKQATTLRIGDLHVDRETREVRRGDRKVELTPKEFALLECLMGRPGKVFSRMMILERVWGTTSDPLTNIVEVYIRQLRRKIDEGQAKPLIQTIRGFGYKILDEDQA